MSVYRFAHTKEMLLEAVSLKTDTFSAALMEDNYIYSREQKSFASTLALSVQTVPAVFTNTYLNETYRAYLDALTFTDVTADVSHILIYADGVKGLVDRPLLFAVSMEPTVLVNSDFVSSWSAPFFTW